MSVTSTRTCMYLALHHICSLNLRSLMFMLFLIPLDVGVVTSVRVGFGSISVTESSCLWKHLNYMYVYIHTYMYSTTNSPISMYNPLISTYIRGE
jgi:hypothetical protein